MARIPMVTRTITTTDATILCVNPENRQLEEVVLTLPRTYNDNNAIMKYIDKHNLFEGKVVKPVSVVSTTVNAKLYKMTEEKFVEVATPCDDDDTDDVADDESTETETDNQ